MKVGSFLLCNDQLFRIIRFEDRKLWKGAPSKSKIAIVIGITDNVPQEHIIPEKDLPDYQDVTDDIKMINEYFVDSQDDPTIIPEMYEIERKNADLKIEIGNLKLERDKYKEESLSFQKELKKLDEEFEDFRNGPAGIRLTREKEIGFSPASIRESYYGKNKNANEDDNVES